MNKQLCILFILGSLNSFSGELVSRKSLERLDFKHDSHSNTLSIISYTPMMNTVEIDLKAIKSDKSSINLFAAVRGVKGPQGYYTRWQTENFNGEWGPGAYPFAALYDIALLPFKAPIKGLRNMQLKRDYTKLMKAINIDGEV
jgi:hypothetical protein